MPDPEETERDGWHQVATVFPSGLTTVAYRYESGGWWIPDPDFNEASLVGATITPLYSQAEVEELIAARRLSESEIRRDQAERDIRIIEELAGANGVQNRITAAVRAQFTPSPETEQEPRFLYARCDGSGRCSALYHVHGCFTEHGRDACDTPDAHDSGETE